MTEIGEVSVRKRRSRQEIKQLVAEFETSGLRRSEFCHRHNLALGTLQRGLRKRRMEVDGQSESKRLVEGIRQSNPPSGLGVFLMHCRHDGNRRGWRSEAAKPPRDQTTGEGIRKQWTAPERILSEA